jgi:hypothetical protein
MLKFLSENKRYLNPSGGNRHRLTVRRTEILVAIRPLHNQSRQDRAVSGLINPRGSQVWGEFPASRPARLAFLHKRHLFDIRLLFAYTVSHAR